MEKENKAFKIFRVIINLNCHCIFIVVCIGRSVGNCQHRQSCRRIAVCVADFWYSDTRNKYKSLKEKLKKNIFGKIVLYGINFLLYRTSLLRFDCYGSNDICLHTTAKTKCNRNRTWRSSYRERPEYDAYRQNKQRR